MQAHELFWYPIYWHLENGWGNAKARSMTEHGHIPKMRFSVRASKAQTVFSTH